jgi:hypothetical protein
VGVLRVARGATRGKAAVALSNGAVPRRSPLTRIARSEHALAAVNGGYFSSRRGLDGDPVGALAVGGMLVSEPVAGRPALLLARDADAHRIAPLRFAGSVVVAGASRLLDGVDRPRGKIPACGGRGGDRPTQRPNPNLVCTDGSELVLFNSGYGTRTPRVKGGVEVTVTRDGMVTGVKSGGGTPIPSDGYVLSGSGDAAAFLRARAGLGARPEVNLSVRAGARRVRPESFDGIVSGGPLLLAGGRVTAARDPSASLRSPRTLAGLRAGGDLLLVTVDGRAPGFSVGVTLPQAARLMRRLGARDALNLDGGGSTTMTVGNRVVNRPSDGRARAVSDGLVVVPR